MQFDFVCSLVLISLCFCFFKLFKLTLQKGKSHVPSQCGGGMTRRPPPAWGRQQHSAAQSPSPPQSQSPLLISPPLSSKGLFFEHCRWGGELATHRIHSDYRHSSRKRGAEIEEKRE